jgi:hypothetical protein
MANKSLRITQKLAHFVRIFVKNLGGEIRKPLSNKDENFLRFSNRARKNLRILLKNSGFYRHRKPADLSAVTLVKADLFGRFVSSIGGVLCFDAKNRV